MSSITLAIPPSIVLDARAYAQRHATTLNRMIRDYLAGLVGASSEGEDLADEFARLVKERGAKRVRPYRFRREDAYEEDV